VYNDFSQIRVADIPGLIEGAHQGIGLGINFLKHIARSRMLLYVIDMAGTDGREPWQDYRALRRELRSYDKTLLKLPFVIVANKMDIADAEKKLRRFKREIKRDPIPISALEATGINELKNALWDIIRPLPPDSTVVGNANNDIDDAMADYDDNAIIDAKKLASAKFLDIGTTGKTTRKRIRH
jgi:GTP-binding protein